MKDTWDDIRPWAIEGDGLVIEADDIAVEGWGL